jgi:peptidoglycan hydrolase-like amidase
MVLEDGGGKVLLRSSSRFFLKYAEASGTSIIAGIVAGAPGINRSYRGELEFIFTPEGITVVNILNIEDYLYSVVPSEMPASWPEEALKAQAIAARSYAAAQIGQFADKGFDLYGTPRSMAYQGIGAENKTTSKAVDATRGMILRGGEEPLRAYFSANHGGYSEDSLVMWGYDAWMAGVPDVMLDERSRGIPPGELDHWLRSAPPSYSSVRGYHFASSYRWEKWVAADEIRYRLSLRGEDPGTIERIVSRGRGVSGRIYALEAEGKEKSVTVAGDAIWYAMGALRSSLFTIAYKYDKTGNVEYVIFRGAGHGHGIGLDQHGAAGMAGSGYSVEEILRHYYPRAEISRW